MPEAPDRLNKNGSPSGAQSEQDANRAGRLPIPNTGAARNAEKKDEQTTLRQEAIQPERSSRVVNRVIDRLNRL